MKIRKQYVISISYFNFLFALGGTDKFINEQREYYNNKGYSYLSIYSTNFLSGKFKLPCNNKWIVMFEKDFIGVFSTSDLILFLKEVDKYSTLEEYIINHLMKMPIMELNRIFYNIRVPVSFYIHDYYTLCPHSGLIDCDGLYCGKSRIEMICQTEACKAGKDVFFPSQFETFISSLGDRLTLFFPSTCAKEIWEMGYPYLNTRKEVLPHYRIVSFKEVPPRPIPDEGKINVAYVGADLLHKGYGKWADSIQKNDLDNDSFNFYHFGSCKNKLKNVEYVNIDYTVKEKSLTERLQNKDIHCVVLWSLVPETFSYTYFESYCADCFVISNYLSGNIADQINQNRNGFVCGDLDGLYGILKNESELRKKLKEFFGKERVIPKTMESNRVCVPDVDDIEMRDFYFRKSPKQIILSSSYQLLELIYKQLRRKNRILDIANTLKALKNVGHEDEH